MSNIAPITSKLVPKTVSLTLAGEEFEVKPFGFGQLPKVSAKLLPLLSLFQAQEGRSITLTEIAEHGGDSLMDVLAMAINRDRAFIDGLDLDDGPALLSAVIAVNQEQLTKKALPLLLKLLGTAAQGDTAATQKKAPGKVAKKAAR